MPTFQRSTKEHGREDGCSSFSMSCESNARTEQAAPGQCAQICLKDFRASLEATKNSLRVTEGDQAFLMPSPKFKSEATFELRGLSSHSHMTVGYIQVVRQRSFRLVYTRGKAEWEFDGVPKDSAISDSDGRLLPFFGVDHEIVSFRNGLVEQPSRYDKEDGNYRVEMADEPRAKICWRIPSTALPAFDGAKSTLHSDASPAPSPDIELNSVERHQKFCTWLVVHDHVNQTLTPIVAAEWGIDLVMEVNQKKPVGKRTAWRPVHIEQPEVLIRPPPIPWTALHNTRTANMLDRLTWRPSDDREPLVIVPAADSRLRVLKSPPPVLGCTSFPFATEAKASLLNKTTQCDAVENNSSDRKTSVRAQTWKLTVKLPSLFKKALAYGRHSMDAARSSALACFLASTSDE